MIQTVNVKTSAPTLSALQLVKGVKKDEETFVAALENIILKEYFFEDIIKKCLHEALYLM